MASVESAGKGKGSSCGHGKAGWHQNLGEAGALNDLGSLRHGAKFFGNNFLRFLKALAALRCTT